MFKIIILEDDPMIALDLKDLVIEAGLSVITTLNDPIDLINWEGEQPDLAILDINLNASLSGIDVAKHLDENKICKHIFVSSYFDSETIKRASLTNPLAYILKPFEEKEVIINLQLAQSKLSKTPVQNSPQISKNEESSDQIFIKTSKSLLKIYPKDVLYIEAYDIYSKIYKKDKKIVASQSLKNLASVFEKYNFLRVHRSYIVNINAIEMIQEDEIRISDKRLPIGRTYKKDFFEKLVVV